MPRIWSVRNDIMQVGSKCVYRVEIDCADDDVAAEFCDKLSAILRVETIRHRHKPADDYIYVFTDTGLWEKLIDEINNEEL